MMTAAMAKVRISDTDMEYSTPSRPKKIGSTHHAPFAYKNKDRVQNHIQDSTGQSGHHGKLWVPVGPDDGVHGLAEHIKGDAQGDIEEVFLAVAEGLMGS